ncbi:hypothetical protein CDD82_1964 [Ophiocordyceps australis]|uniref:Uncharacterized protein n=1 Tax=Ophiocordyceps australis TaxID=1399860 RepID=A0A2C5ZJG9_9HYPO|nr:hypothetical protein CDD82_1964 [Ophiocordyceps australis]
MALWPFRRKSSHKWSRGGVANPDRDGLPLRVQHQAAITDAASKKKQRTEPAKLQRRPRTYSFSPSRHDSIRVHHSRASRQPASDRQSATGDSTWERLPTLHPKNSQALVRRKSSKRRRDDHEREAEIKAMSAYMPTRAISDAHGTGTLIKRSSKRAKTSSGGGNWDIPLLNTSLPLFDSMCSNQSSDSECVSYKISALDSLTPRPTLRYAPGSRWTLSRDSAPTRPGSHKKESTGKDIIVEEDVDSHKRIDDLADGLGASDLRELMERDNRRRERKCQHDQERMQRRLARRAEKQRIDEANAKMLGTAVPQNLERGVFGRELVGLGLEPASATVTSSRNRSPQPPVEPMPDVEPAQAVETLPQDEQIEVTPLGQSPAVEQHQIPIVQTIPPAQPTESASPLPHASLLANLLRSKKSQSKSTLSSDKNNADDECPRKNSQGSNKTARLSFASFFRWGMRNRRSSGPSSFSNTSREEMQAAAATHANASAKGPSDDGASPSNLISSRPGAATPKRTRSRFREDLPDYPLSPPDSRVQSPEGELPLPKVVEVKTPVTPQSPMARHETAPSGPRPIPVNTCPTGSSERLYHAISPDHQQSMSLASIDSEGSWLSGKVGSRCRSGMRDSMVRTSLRDQTVSGSQASSSHEDVLITDDDYLSQLAPKRATSRAEGRADEGRPSSDEDEPARHQGMRWGAVGAKPQVVQFHRHDRDTMRSREGLLNIIPGMDDDDSDVPMTPMSLRHGDIKTR